MQGSQTYLGLRDCICEDKIKHQSVSPLALCCDGKSERHIVSALIVSLD